MLNDDWVWEVAFASCTGALGHLPVSNCAHGGFTSFGHKLVGTSCPTPTYQIITPGQVFGFHSRQAGKTGRAAGLLPWRKFCEGQGSSPGKLAFSEDWQERVRHTLVCQGSNERDLVYSAVQAKGHTRVGSLTVCSAAAEGVLRGSSWPPKWGTLKYGTQRNDIKTTEREEEQDKGF